MRFKKYEVSDMKEAMKVIKEDLGPDAIILSTKPIMKHKSLGLLAKPSIEVIATADYKSATSSQARGSFQSDQSQYQPISQSQLSRQSTYNSDTERRVSTQYPQQRVQPQSKGSFPPPSRRNTLDIRVDDENVESYKPRSLIDRTSASKDIYPSDLLQDLAGHTMPEIENARLNDIAELYIPSQRRSSDFSERVYSSNQPSSQKRDNSRVAPIVATPAPKQYNDDKLNTLIDEISIIKRQLSDIKNSSSPMTALNISDRLKDFYSTLCKAGVDGVIAYRLLRDFEKIISDSYSNIQLKNLLIDELSQIIDIESDYNNLMHGNVMAFIGPTGVGKTTTVAKIAANLKLKDRKSVALITIDSYRIGAVEQLRTYAEIVDMPLYVASSPDELQTMIADLRKNYDNVLIDTMGRSQYDTKEIELLRTFFAKDSGIMLSILLSLSSNHTEMIDTLERYSVLNPKYLILTKLDETKYFGPLINIPFKKKLPLLLLTTGQNVPDDIELPDGKKIARKLLQDIPTLWGEGRF